MGASYIHKCSACGHEVRTSGPWEFYRDAAGNVQPYGHPSPVSKDAEDAGIHGLLAELYCPGCGKSFEAIVIEFKEPCRFALSVWSGGCEPKDVYKQPDAVKCPGCGRTDLLFEPSDAGVACPRCKDGSLVGEMEWIS